MPLLKESLQKESFYQNSMSLFLKGSPGIPERCTIYYNILMNVINSGEDMFKYLNIFYYQKSGGVPRDYFDLITETTDAAASARTAFDNKWLDEIAALLGISREVYCPGGKYVKDSLDGKATVVTLTNYELLVYIQATIAKYNFDGTCQKLREIYSGTPIYMYDNYKKYDDPAIKSYLSNIAKPSVLTELGIWYIGSINSASARIGIGINDQIQKFPNIYTLFLNGFLTIESVGITYEYIIGSNIYTATFAPVNAEELSRANTFSDPPTYLTIFNKEITP